MTQVNFYKLGEKHLDQPDARLLFATRLCEKAYSLGHQIYILTDSSLDTQKLDDLLWQFKATSFLPHGKSEKSTKDSIVLSNEDPSGEFIDVLINLRSKPLQSVSQFAKVNELVGPDEENLQSGRSRYRHYQKCGCSIDTHDL